MTVTVPVPSVVSPKVADTPQLLNRLQVLVVLVCVAFGVVAAVLQVGSWQANGRAADNTEQVVRIQDIGSSLARADALATNGFLVGGIEPTDERAQYDDAVADVLRQITAAAEAQPADQTALAALSAQVSAYTTGIAEARANNRQQNPVASEYLGEAGATLRTDARPILDALIAANQQRATDEMGGQHPFWLFGTGVVVLLVLLLANRVTARRFHRRVNVGLAVAAVVVLLVTLVAGAHAASRASTNDAVRSGPYADTIDEAAARTAANNAKSFESLRLINRGSGATYETPWTAQQAIVDASVSPDTASLWQRYVTAHEAVVKLDDAGNFAGARITATTAKSTGTTAALDAFDQAAQAEIATTAADATQRLRAGGPFAVTLAVLSLLLALVAAGAATVGINQRRREYS